jgi:hypothetical protein
VSKDDGRLPAAPGYSAEPEPVPVSALRASIPSAVLHLRNGRASRHPQTMGVGVTWCGKKLLGKPERSEGATEVFSSYGAEVHVSDDPATGSCERCREAFDAAYSAAFPDGLKPIASFKLNSPDDMGLAKTVLSPETMTRFFGERGEGGEAYERFLAATASAIEARSGETAQQARSGTDESAVSEAETPGNTPPEPLHKEDIR